MDRITRTSISRVRIIDSFQNQKGETIPCVEGFLSLEETISKKGYRYRDGFWSKVLSNKAVQDSIQQRRMLGTIEHPIPDDEYLSQPYESASHVVLDVQLKNGSPWGLLALLNNQKGNSIKALADLDVPVGISTRGMGTFIEDSLSPYVDEENYALITWDFTNKPNIEGAEQHAKISDSVQQLPLFKEMVQMYGLRDSVGSDFNKVKLIQEMEKARDEISNLINKVKRML
nr:MAG TPA: Prohead core protein serine protease [Caudoviricetes sp.]